MVVGRFLCDVLRPHLGVCARCPRLRWPLVIVAGAPQLFSRIRSVYRSTVRTRRCQNNITRGLSTRSCYVARKSPSRAIRSVHPYVFVLILSPIYMGPLGQNLGRLLRSCFGWFTIFCDGVRCWRAATVDDDDYDDHAAAAAVAAAAVAADVAIAAAACCCRCCCRCFCCCCCGEGDGENPNIPAPTTIHA